MINVNQIIPRLEVSLSFSQVFVSCSFTLVIASLHFNGVG